MITRRFFVIAELLTSLPRRFHDVSHEIHVFLLSFTNLKRLYRLQTIGKNWDVQLERVNYIQTFFV